MTSQYKNNIICNWCGENHTSRQCNNENMIKLELKVRVGSVIEEFVEKCIQCPRCSKTEGGFHRLGNNTPSLDIECKNCGLQVEVKSKCLSVNVLPNQIHCKAGNYYSLIKNIHFNNLNMIIIIYSADRKTKEITIKEAIWIDNYHLQTQTNITIDNIEDSRLSKINILDRNFFPRLSFDIRKISFESYIATYLNKIY
jgi:hypothetical protein